MHSHFNNTLLDLPELNATKIHKEDDHFLFEVEPVEHTQDCPICGFSQTIRRGVAYSRRVRHLPAFGRRVYLLLPAIRLSCNRCLASFVWQYDCVASKKRYTK